MKLHDHLFDVLKSPHVSEKSTMYLQKKNTIIFRVAIKSNKKDIKNAVEKLFLVKVHDINTILVKGKRKVKGKYKIQLSNWKKAYITLKKGSNIDFIKNIN